MVVLLDLDEDRSDDARPSPTHDGTEHALPPFERSSEVLVEPIADRDVVEPDDSAFCRSVACYP